MNDREQRKLPLVNVQQIDSRTNYIFLIDKSESMFPVWREVQEAVDRLLLDADLIPSEAQLGLLTTGKDRHQANIDVPLGMEQPRTRISETFRKMQVAGATPLAYTIRQIPKMTKSKDEDNYVFLITDGVDTFGENPCDAAKEAMALRKVHFLPITISSQKSDMLDCLAKVSSLPKPLEAEPGKIYQALESIALGILHVKGQIQLPPLKPGACLPCIKSENTKETTEVSEPSYSPAKQNLLELSAVSKTLWQQCLGISAETHDSESHIARNEREEISGLLMSMNTTIVSLERKSKDASFVLDALGPKQVDIAETNYKDRWLKQAKKSLIDVRNSWILTKNQIDESRELNQDNSALTSLRMSIQQLNEAIDKVLWSDPVDWMKENNVQRK